MLHWAFDTRDPMSSHHQSSNIHYLFPHRHGPGNPFAVVPFEKVKEVYRKIFGDGDVIEPGFEPIEGKVRSAIWFQHRSCIKDSLLLCDWLFPRTFASFESQKDLDQAEDLSGDLDLESKLFFSATGIKMSSRDLEKCGERINNLERAFMIKYHDRNRKIDESIEWLCELPEKTDGTRLDKEIFAKFVDTYYKIRGWNTQNGYPGKRKLEELDLNEIAVSLYE
ncbi:aldehyde ferredoxin oxidoreductase C-terminal domain-containing protein [Actinomycetota bacterium]